MAALSPEQLNITDVPLIKKVKGSQVNPADIQVEKQLKKVNRKVSGLNWTIIIILIVLAVLLLAAFLTFLFLYLNERSKTIDRNLLNFRYQAPAVIGDFAWPVDITESNPIPLSQLPREGFVFETALDGRLIQYNLVEGKLDDGAFVYYDDGEFGSYTGDKPANVDDRFFLTTEAVTVDSNYPLTPVIGTGDNPPPEPIIGSEIVGTSIGLSNRQNQVATNLRLFFRLTSTTNNPQFDGYFTFIDPSDKTDADTQVLFLATRRIAG